MLLSLFLFLSCALSPGHSWRFRARALSLFLSLTAKYQVDAADAASAGSAGEGGEERRVASTGFGQCHKAVVNVGCKFFGAQQPCSFSSVVVARAVSASTDRATFAFGSGAMNEPIRIRTARL